MLTGMVCMQIPRRASRTLCPYWSVHRGQWCWAGPSWELLFGASWPHASPGPTPAPTAYPARLCALVPSLGSEPGTWPPPSDSVARTAPSLLSAALSGAGTTLTTVGPAPDWAPWTDTWKQSLLWSAAWEEIGAFYLRTFIQGFTLLPQNLINKANFKLLIVVDYCIQCLLFIFKMF